jgi:hypothetical protein
MPDQRTPAPVRCLEPGEDDDIVQAVVMTTLLHLHPAQLTADELLRELTADSDDFRELDQVRRAIRDLTRAGLLHRHGPFMIPTRAAVRFNELPDAGT